MATPIDTVKKLMIKDKINYFVIKRPDGRAIVKQNEELSPEDAAEQLDEILSSLTYPYVEVALSKKTTEGKREGGGKADLVHRINLKGSHGAHDTASQNIKDAHINSTIINLMRELGELRAEMVEKEYAAKLALLERKIEDAQEDKRNPMQEAAIMALINMFNGGGGVAAPKSEVINGSPATVQGPTSETERLKIVMYKMKKLRPADYVEVLERLVNAAEANPGKIDMLLNFI